MIKSARLLVVAFISTTLLTGFSLLHATDASSPGQWKITSIKICRSSGGSLNPNIEAIGSYPVYSFFIPRPVWTVNGTVVDAQPIYDRGRLVSFQLLSGASYLKPGVKNTIKFSLPDQNASKVFFYDQTKPAVGDCYEFF